MDYCNTLTMKHMEAAASTRKNYYNKSKKGLSVNVHICRRRYNVLVKNVGLKGKHKLADKWKNDLHIVSEKLDSSMLVYSVQPDKGGPRKTLYLDLLLPVQFGSRKLSQKKCLQMEGRSTKIS